ATETPRDDLPFLEPGLEGSDLEVDVLVRMAAEDAVGHPIAPAHLEVRLLLAELAYRPQSLTATETVDETERFEPPNLLRDQRVERECELDLLAMYFRRHGRSLVATRQLRSLRSELHPPQQRVPEQGRPTVVDLELERGGLSIGHERGRPGDVLAEPPPPPVTPT